jgi:hypothetical protein
MTCSWRLVALAATAAMALACGEDDAGGTGGGDGSGGSGGTVSGIGVSFESASPLTLAPGQRAEIAVTLSPPGPHPVSFLLLGESLDASLCSLCDAGDADSGTVTADVTGRAAVTLQAPSKAAAFEVRAVVGDGQPADIVVRVSEQGTGSLKIVPEYAGHRGVGVWSAAVVTQASCEEVAASAPSEPEGALVASAPAGEVLILDDVPVGPSLAVIARSAHKVWGCADAALERSGDIEEVVVSVLDRPMDLSDVDLALSLTFEAGAADLSNVLEEARDRQIESMFPEAMDEATALLDAMAAQLDGGALTAFEAARADQALDLSLSFDLQARGVFPSDVLRATLDTGRDRLQGQILGRLVSTDAPEKAVLAIEDLGGVEAERAGVPPDHLVSLVANPADTVVLGGLVYFLPTRLLGALALDAALADNPFATSFDDVLADGVGCAAVAEVVGPLDTCHVDCVETTCRLALGALWTSSLDASALAADVGYVSMAVSGNGEVDDEAALLAFEGEWVGVITAEGADAEIEGAAAAEPADLDEGEDGGDDDDGSNMPQ